MHYLDDIDRLSVASRSPSRTTPSSVNHTPIITKTSLNTIHQQQLANGNNNTHNTMRLVEILGGIDNILTDYLSNTSNLTITPDNIEQIHQLITTPLKLQQSVKHAPLTTISNTNNYPPEDRNKMCYTFDKYNNSLVALFDIKKAKIISKTFHSTLTIVLWCISFVFMISSFIIWKHLFFIIGTCCMAFWTLLQIMLILEINIKAIKLIGSTFEFWFKLWYAALWAIFAALNMYETDDFTNVDELAYKITSIFSTIWLLLLICCMSSFDALNINKRFKILWSLLFAVWFTILTISYQFGLSGMEEYVIHITANLSLSTLGIMTSTSRIMCIFTWRQCILTLIRKDRCVSISYTPYCKWTEVENDNNDNDDEQHGIGVCDHAEAVEPEELKDEDHKIEEQVKVSGRILADDENDKSLTLADELSCSSFTDPIS